MTIPLPAFSNDAVAELYKLKYTEADFATIQNILSIGDALIPDLELVINFGIEHLNDFTEDDYNNAITHALLMLAELRATSAFATITKFARQPTDDVEYWLGDTNFTILPRVLAYCGINAIDELVSMLYDDALNNYQRHPAASALGWIGRHFPDKRQQIVEIFRTYLRSDIHRPILEKQRQNRPFGGFPLAQNNEDFPTSVCIALGTLGYKELWEDIEWFWAEGKAFPGLTELSDIHKDLEEQSNVLEIELLSGEALSAIYAWIDESFYKVRDYSHKYRSDGIPGGLEKQYPSSTTLVRKEPKIGRNDPCPFDGVKKFKKCCGAKGHAMCQKV